jgi:hypothetical protein
MRGGSGAHLMALGWAGLGKHQLPCHATPLIQTPPRVSFPLTSPKDSLGMSTDESVKYTFCFLLS